MLNRKSPKTRSRRHSKSFILEPILTPSSIVDTGLDDGLDVPDEGFSLPAEPLMNEGEGMTEGETGFPDDPGLPDGDTEIPGVESGDVSAGDPGSEFEEIPYFPDDALIPQTANIEFTSGVFTVGESGEVEIDYLFDGGKYDRGELAIFSLEGMESEPGTREFIQEAAQRALSNSEQGYVVISDATDGARFSNTAGKDFNGGQYQGVQTFQMKAGDRFGFMLVPNQSIQTAAEGRAWGTVFSMATDNPDDYFQFGQIADVTGDGNTFTLEDISLAGGRSDRDYNDIIFQVRGATADVPLMDEVLGVDQDWRTSSMGQALLNYAQAYTDKVDYSVAAFDAAREFQPLVGIIDTGFAADNPNLDNNTIITGSDFIDWDDNPFLEAGEGDHHGTEVVNVIDGMNDEAPLWLGRAIGSGRWADSLVEFVDAAVESGQPNAVVNLSLDLTQIDADGNVTTRYEFTPMEMAALEYARQNNVLVAAASGNQAGLMSALGQASMQFDNIITVGAAEQFDPAASNWQGYDRADYSSYGAGLDIVANGGTRENPIGGSYGSSMATAQVTGAISQIWAANPDLSYQQVIQILKQTATDLGQTGFDTETGAGLLNVMAAVQLAKATKAGDKPLPLAHINPSFSEDDDVVDIDVFPEVVPEEEFQFDDSPINASERAADLWSKTMTLFMGKDWHTEYVRAESWIGKITTNRPRYWTKDAQGRPWEILYTSNGFIIRNAGLGAFAFTWEEYKNRNAWGLFWRSVYARQSRSQILAFKNAYWGQRSWATQTVGSMRRVVGPNGSGWVQEFDGPNGRRLLMLEDGKTEAFWVLGGNYKEYMAMGGPTGMLGFPRSNENKINRADGRHATWQPFSAGGGKSRIHHLSPGPGSVATWGSIGSLYTDLGGAPHWLGMPTRREYHDGDTIFSDFEGGRIAYNRNTGRTEALRPGQQPSWRHQGNITIKPTSTNLSFSRGQSWMTSTGYEFRLQTDGNLVLYSPERKALWATGTQNTGANKFAVQTDGNVVLYHDNTPLWATNTDGNPGAYFAIQTDGNLVVYSSDKKPLFNTGTDGGRQGILNASELWLRRPEPGYVNGNVGGVSLNLRSSASTGGAVIGSLTQNSSVTILRSVGGGTYTTPNGQTRSDWYEVEVNGKKGFVAAYYVTKGNPTSDNGSYYPSLRSLSTNDWDRQSGDDNQFRPDSPFGGGNQMSKTSDAVRQVYTDLSNAIFGYRVHMNSGYLYDQGYYNFFKKWHAGIDMGAPAGTAIKSVVGGTVRWVNQDFIGIDGDDGNHWVYGHLGTKYVSQGQRIEAGKTLAKLDGQNHLHLEVQNGHGYKNTQGAHPDQNHVRNVTMSPLQAYWNLRN